MRGTTNTENDRLYIEKLGERPKIVDFYYDWIVFNLRDKVMDEADPLIHLTPFIDPCCATTWFLLAYLLLQLPGANMTSMAAIAYKLPPKLLPPPPPSEYLEYANDGPAEAEAWENILVDVAVLYVRTYGVRIFYVQFVISAADGIRLYCSYAMQYTWAHYVAAVDKSKDVRTSAE